MAKLTVGNGLTKYLEQLGNLSDRADGMAGRAIYEGAKIVADQIRANIEGLPVQEKTRGGLRRDPTQVEKDGLLAGLGVAKKQDDGGFINVKIGMDGYNAHVTERYPKGHPNAMIARAINAGSTYMNRYPFIDNAVRATKAAAEDAMREVIDEGINDVMHE